MNKMVDSVMGRPRLHRRSLSREIIARRTLQLLDEDGVDGFSLPRLGRALGADPTAVYRHFVDKDDLTLAVADLLFEEVLDGFLPLLCWHATLADLSHRIRTVFRLHPAAGSIASPRMTRRTGEMRVADALIAAILDAGFAGHEAALYYRVVADFSVFWAGSHATYLTLDPQLQIGDESSWGREYATANESKYPHTAQVRHNLADVGFDEIFESALGMLLAGIANESPSSCQCGEDRHPVRRRHTR